MRHINNERVAGLALGMTLVCFGGCDEQGDDEVGGDDGVAAELARERLVQDLADGPLSEEEAHEFVAHLDGKVFDDEVAGDLGFAAAADPSQASSCIDVQSSGPHVWNYSFGSVEYYRATGWGVNGNSGCEALCTQWGQNLGGDSDFSAGAPSRCYVFLF